MKRFGIFIVVIIVAFTVYKLFRQPVQAPTVAQKDEAPLAMSVNSEQETVERVATSVATEDGNPDANIRVSSPQPDAKLTSPFLVTGEARVFENMLSVRVTNKDGKAFINESVYAKAKDVGEFGVFSINLSYAFRNTKEGFVEVYSKSAKDGSEQDLVRIPVIFE